MKHAGIRLGFKFRHWLGVIAGIGFVVLTLVPASRAVDARRPTPQDEDAAEAVPTPKGKKGGAAAKAKAKAGATGTGLADNGILLTFADVTEDSLVSIKTEQGNFEFKFSEIPYGKFVEKMAYRLVNIHGDVSSFTRNV
jgi:hypothetical protein